MSLDKSKEQSCLETIIKAYWVATGLSYSDINSVFNVVLNHIKDLEREQ